MKKLKWYKDLVRISAETLVELLSYSSQCYKKLIKLLNWISLVLKLMMIRRRTEQYDEADEFNEVDEIELSLLIEEMKICQVLENRKNWLSSTNQIW